jgi:hypothetical protein
MPSFNLHCWLKVSLQAFYGMHAYITGYKRHSSERWDSSLSLLVSQKNALHGNIYCDIQRMAARLNIRMPFWMQPYSILPWVESEMNESEMQFESCHEVYM